MKEGSSTQLYKNLAVYLVANEMNQMNNIIQETIPVKLTNLIKVIARQFRDGKEERYESMPFSFEGYMTREERLAKLPKGCPIKDSTRLLVTTQFFLEENGVIAFYNNPNFDTSVLDEMNK